MSEDYAIAYMGTRGISPATTLEFGVGYDASRHAITFPYFDALGRQTTTRWRLLHPEASPKYMGPRGVRPSMYNVKATDEPMLYVTEGEIDCLTLLQLGLPAVGIPGAGAFQPSWRWLFVDHRVRLMFDADPAKRRYDGTTFHPGQEGASRILGILSTTAAHVETVRLPEGSDVNSLHMAGQLAPFVS